MIQQKNICNDYVFVCPKCNNTEVEQLDFDKEFLQTTVICLKCNHSSLISEFQTNEKGD